MYMYGLILYDQGKIGSLNQCKGLGVSLTTHFPVSWQEIPVQFPRWLRWVPPRVALLLPLKYIVARFKIQKKPSIIIASGRQAVLATLALRMQCCTVILQDPKIDPHYVDLVIAPLHDKVSGPNVLKTLGSLHHITEEDLNHFKKSHHQKHITVLLGGDSRHYTYATEDIQTLAHRLKFMLSLPNYSGAKLLITPSRRTRLDLVKELKHQLTGLDYELWDGTGENPYKKYLSMADAFVVTGDSINMMTEACLRGCPTYIFQLALKTKRFEAFFEKLFIQNHAAPFTETALQKNISFIPLNELKRLTPEILAVVQQKVSLTRPLDE